VTIVSLVMMTAGMWLIWVGLFGYDLPVGTRSLLFGVHQVLIHPWFVALAWWRLYGFPWDPRLWVAFFVHDLGYWGKRDMDGLEGETHVELGARIMGRLFDRDAFGAGDATRYRWHDFSLYHSRFYAKKAGAPFSRLCVADKLSICLTPEWLYLSLARLSGEIHEYMSRVDTKYSRMGIDRSDYVKWRRSMCEYIERWCEAHKNGGEDTWTKV
jgi:hypothetical protein